MTRERRQCRDRRTLPRRTRDQTIPPERLYCCPEVLEAIEHHVGNAAMAIGGFLNYLANHNLGLFATRERQGLSDALANLRRLERLKLSMHKCELARCCPASGRTLKPWQQRLIGWVLRF